MSAPAILTWNVEAGDVILAAYPIDFHKDHNARIVRAVYSSYMDAREAPLTLGAKSHLGRPVMLGEDGAEEAFGHDAVYRQVECAVLDDDWRMSPCYFDPEVIVGTLPDRVTVRAGGKP
jgi:hypothetical protein